MAAVLVSFIGGFPALEGTSRLFHISRASPFGLCLVMLYALLRIACREGAVAIGPHIHRDRPAPPHSRVIWGAMKRIRNLPRAVRFPGRYDPAIR